MKNPELNTLIKLALCPGNCDPEDAVCAICTFRSGGEDCHKHLRAEALKEVLPQNPEPKEKPSVADNLYDQVTKFLRELGIPAHIKGYMYAREAIVMAVKDPHLIDAITKELYPLVAKKFSTTSSRVERAIRHAIECAWDRGDWEVFLRIFGHTVNSHKGKPTNSEFVALIADDIRMSRNHSI